MVIYFFNSEINLHILTDHGFVKEFLNKRFLQKDDWGHLRYNILFSFSD